MKYYSHGFLGSEMSFIPRNVAHSTKSCAARISTEPSITPCGGIAIPTAAKMIAAENDAIDRYFFISRKFLSLSRELSKEWFFFNANYRNCVADEHLCKYAMSELIIRDCETDEHFNQRKYEMSE